MKSLKFVSTGLLATTALTLPEPRTYGVTVHKDF